MWFQKFHRVWVWLLFLPLSAFGQRQFFGQLTDAESGAPAAYVQVIMYRYQSAEIVAFCQTNAEGRYELSAPSHGGAFTLRVRSLGYEDIDKDIVIDARENGRFEVNLKLRPKTHLLQQAEVVSRRPPMIVREDTIIYDISHWAGEFDQTLESVLRKVPGFEVLADGEIKVKGRRVDKVLIEGEEIADGGAALFTRTLSPGRIASVEVRFDEKDDKLKESLLSQNKFVTLDIKLKKDFDRSFFGRLTGTVGYQEGPAPGGVAKLFSLREGLKLQLLGEVDNFGEKSIALSNIRNLGAEAYTRIFEIPADFNRLRENPEYNNEVYGFREYTSSEAASAGLTGKVSLSPSLSLFFGTYNFLENVGAARDFTQTPLGGGAGSLQLSEARRTRLARSKNKAELAFDMDGWKGRYNFNLVFGESAEALGQRAPGGRSYDFRDAAQSRETYHNFFLERQFSENQGVQFNALYSNGRSEASRALQHNDPAFRQFLDSTAGAWPQQIEQWIPVRQEKWVGRSFYQAQWGAQVLRAGVRFLEERLAGEKTFSSGAADDSRQADNWIAPWQRRVFRQWLPYLSHRLLLPRLQANSKVGWAANSFSPFDNGPELAHNRILEWKTDWRYDIGEDNSLQFSYSQSTARLPLYQLLPGWELTGFQSVAVPGRFPLAPRRERVAQFSATSFALSSYGIALELAGISGKSFNAPAMGLNEFGLVEQSFHQLPTEYAVIVGKIAKVFNGVPLQVKLEPSIIRNRVANQGHSGGAPEVRSTIRTVDFRVFTTFDDYSFDFEGRLKYSGFVFDTDTDAFLRGQDMWNAYLKYEQRLWQRRLQLSATIRYTAFRGQGEAGLALLDMGLRYRQRRMSVFLTAHNLLDARQFVVQEISPALYTDARRFIFGRFLKAGISIDVN